MRPAGLAVAVRQRRGGGSAAVGGALLVPGTPLLARVECAADAHSSGEVGTVGHGGAADVVGRRGGTGCPLGGGAARRRRRMVIWSNQGGGREDVEEKNE